MEVPVPITRWRGRPDIFHTIYVTISTGLAATTKMPSKPLAIMSVTISLVITAAASSTSSLVWPGLGFAPAVRMTTSMLPQSPAVPAYTLVLVPAKSMQCERSSACAMARS
ncbi:hypothetical protein D3C80_1927550 [compost metagenome]